MMDRVGGYVAYLELLEDDQAYCDVQLVMEAEADAARVRGLMKEAGGR